MQFLLNNRIEINEMIKGIELESRIESSQDGTRLLKEHYKHVSSYMINVADWNLSIHPKVFCPVYSHSSLFLMENIKIKKGTNVLDMGTGCGIQAMNVLGKGADCVIAVDVNPMAVKCARENLAKYFEDKRKYKVFESDLFENLPMACSFNIIIFNLPFHNRPAKNLLELSIHDKNYRTMKKFFLSLINYLKKNGQAYVPFSTLGELDVFYETLERNNLNYEMIAHKYEANYRWDIYIIYK